MSSGLARSVQARLINHAKELGLDPNNVLARYAAERFLYRLSKSPYSERFILKGALLLLAWLGETIRPTRDADVLGLGDLDAEALAEVFTEICTVPVEPDALVFDPASIRIAQIRPEDAYGGQRVALTAHLGPARLKVQVDVGIGDAVSPPPEWLEYPSLLDLPRPRLRAYRPETAIAEKVHAMVVLGGKNSRMRDFFDINALAARMTFDGRELTAAIVATFERRRTKLPSDPPFALTSAFADVEGKRAQWDGFVRRLQPATAPLDLAAVMKGLAAFVGPPLFAGGRGRPFDRRWPPGGPWSTGAE